MTSYKDLVLSHGPQVFVPMMDEPGAPAELYGGTTQWPLSMTRDTAVKHGTHWTFNVGAANSTPLVKMTGSLYWRPRDNATYMYWFKMPPVVGTYHTMWKGSSSTSLEYRTSNPGQLIYRVMNNAGVWQTDVANNEWHFAVISTDSAGNYYVSTDGVPLRKLTLSSSISDQIMDLTIGGSTTTATFPGAMFGMARLPKVLTDAEVQELYVAGRDHIEPDYNDPAKVYPRTVLEDSPAIFVPMNEPAGSTTGVVLGSKSSTASATGVSTVVGDKYWTYDGAKTNVVSNTAAHSMKGTSSTSHGIWMRMPTDGMGGVYYQYSTQDRITNTGGVPQLYVDGNGSLHANGSIINATYPDLRDGKWHHVMQAGEVLYVDGVSVGTTKSYFGNMSYNFRFSGDYSGDYFKGDLWGFSFHETALSADRVQKHYTDGLNALYPDPDPVGGGTGSHFTLYTGGQEVPLTLAGAVIAGELIPVTFDKILMPAPSRYYDVTPITSYIDANNDWPFNTTEANQLEADYMGETFGYAPTNGFSFGSEYTSDMIVMDDPQNKQSFKIVADQLAKYPAEFIKTNAATLKRIIFVKNMKRASDPGHDYGGLAIKSTGYMYLDTYGMATLNGTFSDDGTNGVEQLVHHEIHHHLYYTDQAFFNALEAEWTAKNPSPYIGLAANDLPINVRPEGFTRRYGRSAYIEDVAEVFSHIMATGLQPMMEQALAEDPILAWKVKKIKDWLATKHEVFADPRYYEGIHRT